MITIKCQKCNGDGYTYFKMNNVPWTMPCDDCKGKGTIMLRDTTDVIQDHIDMRLEGSPKGPPSTDTNVTGTTMTISMESIPICDCDLETSKLLHDLGNYCQTCQSFR